MMTQTDILHGGRILQELLRSRAENERLCIDIGATEGATLQIGYRAEQNGRTVSYDLVSGMTPADTGEKILEMCRSEAKPEEDR